MKKIHFIYVTLLIGAVTFWSGCSKNDDTNPDLNPEQEITMPKEAFQFQIVEAQFSEPLLQEEYDADLGGVPLTLIRSDENTLVFYIPGETVVGETTLNIPNLDVKTKLEVKKSMLNDSEDVVLKPFFEDLHLTQNTITDEEYSSYLTETIAAFEIYYQSLSNDEKNRLALFYQVNENWFKDILSLNQSLGFPTLDVSPTFKKAGKLAISVAAFATLTSFIVQPGTYVEKAILAVGCIISAVLAKEYTLELLDEIDIIEKITNRILGSQSTKSTLATQALVFVNAEAKNISLYTEQRNITTSDQSSTAEGTSMFFDAYERLINTTEKVNNVIRLVNNHVFFSNISPIPIQKIPSSSETQSVPLTLEDYNSLSFTVSHANVQLSELAFENGSIRMKMTVENPDAVTGNNVKTYLNYVYQNEFNDTKGNIPIEIKLDKEGEFNLAGDWKLTILINDYPPKIYIMEMDESGIWIIDQAQYPSADYQIEMNYSEGVLYLSFDGGKPYELEVNDVNDTIFETHGEDEEDGLFFNYYVKLERL